MGRSAAHRGAEPEALLLHAGCSRGGHGSIAHDAFGAENGCRGKPDSRRTLMENSPPMVGTPRPERTTRQQFSRGGWDEGISSLGCGDGRATPELPADHHLLPQAPEYLLRGTWQCSVLGLPKRLRLNCSGFTVRPTAGCTPAPVESLRAVWDGAPRSAARSRKPVVKCCCLQAARRARHRRLLVRGASHQLVDPHRLDAEGVSPHPNEPVAGDPWRRSSTVQ